MRRPNIGLAGFALCVCALAALPLGARAVPNPLARTYHEGETLRYLMTGDNDGRRYQAQATGAVKKDGTGRFIEEIAWSNLIEDGVAVDLPPASVALRQVVSLDPGYKASIPNLAGVAPGLIGPVLDLLTFYVDLQLAARQGALAAAGDHVLVPYGKTNSWADGKRVLIGEDAIDFDITLASLNQSAHEAVVIVRHVPPAQPAVRILAPWMRTRVADTENNWVQIVKTESGYLASAGKETFDVRITIDLRDGRIRNATMDNPVVIRDRTCSDAALTACAEPIGRQIRRVIKLAAR